MKRTLLSIYLLLITAAILLSACGGSRSAQNGSQTPVSAQAPKPKKGIDTLELERAFIDGCKYMALEDYNKAVQIFEGILKMDPDNAPTLYELGKIYIEFGSVGDALNFSQRATTIDPNNRDYALLYAGILNYSGQFLKAADAYQSMIDRGLSDAETYYQLAETFEKAGKRQDAINTLLELHKKIGNDEMLVFELQRLYATTEQYPEAIQWMEMLVDMNPENPMYLRYLSDYYTRNGETEKAEKTFAILLEIDPSNTDLLFRKAEMQQKAGNQEGYLATMRQAFGDPKGNIDTKIFYLVLFVDSIGSPAFKTRDKIFEWTELLIQAHPEDAKAYAMRGDFLYYDNQLQAAADIYNKSLKLRNDVFDVWLKMFYIYADLQKYDSLLLYTNLAIELYPNQPVSYYFAGVAANQQDQYADAVKVLRRGLPLAVSNMQLRASMLSMLGDAYHELGEHVQSDDAYENSIRINPDDVFTLNNYAYYLSLRKENLERAAELAKRANELRPGNASLEDTYAWVLYQQGKYAEAKKWLEKALANGGEKSGVIHEHYGDVLYQTGDTAKALEHWKLAREYGEASDLIDKKIAEGKLIE